MDDISLLFDHSYAFLGEVTTRQGSMRRIMLSGDGERRLEANLRDWQSRGVPVLREVMVPIVKGHPSVFFQERVQTRDPGFLTAVRQWAEGHGMALITVSDDVMACWGLLSRLPLEPREQFVMLVSLRNAKKEDLRECTKALADAVDAAEGEQEKAQKAISQLWDRAAKELVSQFAT